MKFSEFRLCCGAIWGLKRFRVDIRLPDSAHGLMSPSKVQGIGLGDLIKRERERERERASERERERESGRETERARERERERETERDRDTEKVPGFEAEGFVCRVSSGLSGFAEVAWESEPRFAGF